MDRIEINGLRVMTLVGVLPHEREAPQPLEVNLVLEVDLSDAGFSDELADTAHYGLVAERAAAVMRESKDLLLERLAHRIAAEALLVDRVEAVEVTLTKLRPPIPEDLQSTAVGIRRDRKQLNVPARQQHLAIVALGSNLGDRVGFLRFGVEQLGSVVRVSRVYETDAVGGPDQQGAYLNMVAVVETPLDPFALIRRCQRIEAMAGRQRIVHWGPRTLDIDLLFYDDATISTEDLLVPHPRIAQRRFVLHPLSDVAPERCPEAWDDLLPKGGVWPIGELAALVDAEG
ncbi:MAG: 2-amino-4-hydroxy-6-hydroxymethyldihydropteridine diphosphokinase [Actinobacteria bacterium]|uniref:2-amino-4-hydroxy-6-hydroxymethyldihydropteridine diphosphokinase n=1 Tax=freshwater metagenome TaxID=449393 RepID=A0A6J6R898_9ZZZZ|nr:2-amino-4-hydroxy-6-hydroxymethyldihydropteridine diphosphokinase [Actinomycetota bacterium]MSZ04088.1 2-amino-4-hydroxy-6-hydroxymethyldihydropteridine diphosphokinase [Actinomycetota bacterium]MTB06062.1 2-amino-4-hydroxy-6-hydroxymethyldihydropteridine diphosphokinase [Actinomycetota bacterium]